MRRAAGRFVSERTQAATDDRARRHGGVTLRTWLAAVLAVGMVCGVCSSESSGSSSSPAPTAAASVPSDGEPPRVDLIEPAIAALEAQLGLPQQYFEINATSHLVNL